MTKKVALEPGLEVTFSDMMSKYIKSKPEDVPVPIQTEVFDKKIRDIYARKPIDGRFQANREIQRRLDIADAFQTVNVAIKFGVQSRDSAAVRSSRGTRIRDVDRAVDVIRRELDEGMVTHSEDIFLEPASIESKLRPKSSHGSGLVALANASFILSKYMQEKNDKPGLIRNSDGREVFSPLDAYRKGYALDYLEGIRGLKGIEYIERAVSDSPEEHMLVQQRNNSRADKKEFILQKSYEKREVIRGIVSDMRTKGVREIEFQLSQLMMNKNRQKFDIEKSHIEALETCVTKFYMSSSSEEKNIIARCPLVRKILATAGSSGAAGWHLWAESEYNPEDFIFPPLTASATVMESLLRPPKNSNIPVYKAEKRPRGWNFMEFDLVGSHAGRVFVAHRIDANTGDMDGFDGHGDLWIVLIVSKNPHQGTRSGRYMDKYKVDIENRFNQWASLGLRDPFIRET